MPLPTQPILQLKEELDEKRDVILLASKGPCVAVQVQLPEYGANTLLVVHFRPSLSNRTSQAIASPPTWVTSLMRSELWPVEALLS